MITVTPIESLEQLKLIVKEQGSDFDNTYLSFLFEKDLTVHTFIKVEFEDYLSRVFFVISRTILPSEPKNIKLTIFERLKAYGESKRYLKIVDDHNNIIFDASCTEISHFYNTLFIVKSRNKYGVFNLLDKIICPIEYERIYPVSEYVFGIAKGEKIGFMDTYGKIIIPIEYDHHPELSYRYEGGKVLVRKEIDNVYCEFSIDHHNNIVDDYRIIHDYNYYPNTFEGSTAYRGDSDISDAYEGNTSNLWNTD